MDSKCAVPAENECSPATVFMLVPSMTTLGYWVPGTVNRKYTYAGYIHFILRAGAVQRMHTGPDYYKKEEMAITPIKYAICNNPR